MIIPSLPLPEKEYLNLAENLLYYYYHLTPI
jgi:hypothetical protein